MAQAEQPELYFPLPYSKEVPKARQLRLIISAFSVLLDCVSIQIGAALGVLAYRSLFNSTFRMPPYVLLEFCAEYTFLFVCFSFRRELYKHTHSLLNVKETADTLRVSVLCLALIGLSIFLHHVVVPRLALLLGWVFSTSFVLFQKHLSRDFIVAWKSRDVQRRNVLIVGAGGEARRIFSILRQSPDLGLCPVALVVEDQATTQGLVYSHDYASRSSAPLLCENVSSHLISRLNISEIYVADPGLSENRIVGLIDLARELSLPVSFVGNKTLPGFGSSSTRFLDGLYITSTVVAENRDVIYAFAKRSLDILISGLFILFTLPVWAAISVWVVLSSDGPVFFRQTRIGQEGHPFEILKFRSMYTTAPKYGVSPEDSHDPRITPAGRFLRKTSLDELPQLLNVFKGDMSLVGPRPEMPFIVRDYSAHVHQRLLVPQGMTGIWQLSADRRLAIHERLEYDLYYLEEKDFFFDLAILIHTALFAMKGI